MAFIQFMKIIEFSSTINDFHENCQKYINFVSVQALNLFGSVNPKTIVKVAFGYGPGCLYFLPGAVGGVFLPRWGPFPPPQPKLSDVAGGDVRKNVDLQRETMGL